MAAKNREQDQKMAAALKAAGVKREICRCPICNQIVSLTVVYQHLAYHPA